MLRLEKYAAAEAAFSDTLETESEYLDDAQFGLGWVALGRGDQNAASWGKKAERSGYYGPAASGPVRVNPLTGLPSVSRYISRVAAAGAISRASIKRYSSLSAR